MRTDMLPVLGSPIARYVTADDAQALIESACERSYSAGANARRAGIALFSHARVRRILVANPLREVNMPSIAVKPTKRQRIVLNAEQLRAFQLGLTHYLRWTPRWLSCWCALAFASEKP